MALHGSQYLHHKRLLYALCSSQASHPEDAKWMCCHVKEFDNLLNDEKNVTWHAEPAAVMFRRSKTVKFRGASLLIARLLIAQGLCIQ